MPSEASKCVRPKERSDEKEEKGRQVLTQTPGVLTDSRRLPPLDTDWTDDRKFTPYRVP
jgi:hypothetical protein